MVLKIVIRAINASMAMTKMVLNRMKFFLFLGELKRYDKIYTRIKRS